MKQYIIIIGGLLIFLFWPSLGLAAWYTDCPECKKHLGGSGRGGPYSSKEQCEYYRSKMRADGFPFGSCYGSDDTSSGGGTGGGSSFCAPDGRTDLTTFAMKCFMGSFSEGLKKGLQGSGRSGNRTIPGDETANELEELKEIERLESQEQPRSGTESAD